VLAETYQTLKFYKILENQLSYLIYCT